MDSLSVNTWAGVAQQFLEYGKVAVSELSNIIKGVAPEVWEMCVRQVYAEAIGDMWVLIFLAISVYMCVHLKKSWKRINETWPDELMVGYMCVSWLGFIGFLIASTTNSVHLVKALINPNYYAIQEFFKMIGGNQ